MIYKKIKMFGSFSLQQPSNNVIFRLVIVTYFFVACLPYSGAQYFKGNSYGSYTWRANYKINDDVADVKTIYADMTRLRSGKSNSLHFHKVREGYAFLRIYVTEVDPKAACTRLSDQLLLQRGQDRVESTENSTPLLCGNEVTHLHSTQFPFSLTFTRGVETTITKFNISVDYSSVFPTSKYDSLPVSTQPSIFYSPLYPDFYPDNLQLVLPVHLDEGHGLFYQLRYASFETGCIDQLRITGSDDYRAVVSCNNELHTDVLIPQSYLYNNGIVFEFNTDGSIREQGFALEYRSVKIGFQNGKCIDGDVSSLLVDQATMISWNLEDTFPGSSTSCNTIFKAKSNEVLVVTSLMNADEWSRLCGNYAVHVFLGEHSIFHTGCLMSTFGVIRTQPGQHVKIAFRSTVVSVDFQQRVKFLVEPYDKDALPGAIISRPLPSYIWHDPLPANTLNPYRNVTDSVATQFLEVRSPRSHCVEFSILNEDLSRTRHPFARTAHLYSGYGVEGNFPLVETCLGQEITDRVVHNGPHRVTTVAAASRESFWLNITNIASSPCDPPKTFLQIEDPTKTYSLFGPDSKVVLTRHMTCKFVLPPSSLSYVTPVTKFRGRLSNMADASMYVTEDPNPNPRFVMTHFDPSMSDWYSSPHNLYVHFKTGSDVIYDMVELEYKDGDNGLDPFEPMDACPGPQEIVLYDKTAKDFITPDYPNRLQTNATCKWTFRRLPGAGTKYIHISIKDLGLSCHSSTKLFVRPVDDGRPSAMDQVCDQDEYFQVFPGDVEVILLGGPDNLVKGIAFEAKLESLDYQSKCNKTYEIHGEGKSLDLTGTLHDGHYLVPFICQIHLFTEDPGDFLTVVLRNVDMAQTYYTFDCFDKNGLFVYNGRTELSPLLIHTCKNNGQSVSSSTNHVLVVISILDKTEHPVTFNLSIKKGMACSGETRTLYASKTSQYFTSENYPSAYRADSHCSWVIRSSDGHEVEIEVQHMDLEYSSSCEYDYVQVYDGSNSRDHSLGRVCGRKRNLPKFRSSDQVLFVYFESDIGAQGSGFKIRFYTSEEPTSGLGDGGSTTYTNDYSDDDDGDTNKTGVIIGACLSAIVGVFGIGFLCVWLVHKKRIRDVRARQRRRREAAAFSRRNGQDSSSVFVINPLVINNAPPPPYAGLINQGFLEEPPPSYRDALSQLVPPPPPPLRPDASTGGRAPPPPYSVALPRGHEAISEDEEGPSSPTTTTTNNNNNNNNNNNTYDTATPAPADGQRNSSNVPAYQSLIPLQRLAVTSGGARDRRDSNPAPPNPPPPPPPPPLPSQLLQRDSPSSPSTTAPSYSSQSARQNNTDANSISLSNTPNAGNEWEDETPDYNTLEDNAYAPSDYNTLEGGNSDTTMPYNNVVAEEPLNHSAYSLAREPQRNHPPPNEYSLARHVSRETTFDVRSSPVTTVTPMAPPPSYHNNDYSLARNPETGITVSDQDGGGGRAGEDNLAFDAEEGSDPEYNEETCEYDLAQSPPPYTLANQNPNRQTTERSSRSFSDSTNTNDAYSLAVHSTGSRRQQHDDYSLARARSNSESCDNGAGATRNNQERGGTNQNEIVGSPVDVGPSARDGASALEERHQPPRRMRGNGRPISPVGEQSIYANANANQRRASPVRRGNRPRKSNSSLGAL